MSVDTSTWIGQTLAGRYQVIAQLGAGGMGFVYKAHDQKLNSDVVVKVPRPEMLVNPQFAGRFAREVRSMVKLAHPHIVKVMDVGEHEGIPFAVLQFLAGGSLRDRQQSGRDGQTVVVEPFDLLGWLAGVADALDFIHAKGYIHRDVKPDNILFDSAGHVFLSDFGVAKVVADNRPSEQKTVLTNTGAVIGTVRYLAPELLLEKPYDGRADQYALAVTVYELLCGRAPFDGPSAVVAALHMTQPAPLLHTVLPSIPKALSALVHKAMAKDPRERYASCVAFAQALAQGISNPDITLQPEGAAETGQSAVAVTRVFCPSCGQNIKIPATAAGKRLRCPKCQTPFQAPATELLQPHASRQEAPPSGGRKSPEKAALDTGAQARQDTPPAGRPSDSATGTKRKTKLPPSTPPSGERKSPEIAVAQDSGERKSPEIAAAQDTLPSGGRKSPEIAAAQDTPPSGGRKSPEIVAALRAAPTAWLVAGGAAVLFVTALLLTWALVKKSKPVQPVAALQLSLIGVTLHPGESQAVVVMVERHDCSGPVKLEVDGLPDKVAGIAGAIADNQNIGRIELIAAADAATVEKEVRVLASIGEVRTEELVKIAVKKPTMALRLLPAAVTLTPGARKTVEVRVERHGCKGPVTVQVEGLLDKVTVQPVTIASGEDTGKIELLAAADAEGNEKQVRFSAALGELRTENTAKITILPKAFTNSIGMKLVLLPAGKFTMGSPESEKGRGEDEGPQHEVEITKPFYMGSYEVTQEEYERVMEKNLSRYSRNGSEKDKVAGMDTSHFPMDVPSWDMAVNFCRKISELPEEKRAGRSYRLPTEAEWEYACRAGTKTVFHFGDSLSSDQANINGNYPSERVFVPGVPTDPFPRDLFGAAPRKNNPAVPPVKGKFLVRPTVVGSYPPNAFGLYDMHGNVGECCEDWYDKDYYKQAPAADPQGPLIAASRVVRGGGWNRSGYYCRSASRRYMPASWDGALGFRVVCVVSSGTSETKTEVVPSIPAPEQSQSKKEVANSIGMKLVLIPAGKFMMGSPASEKDRSDDEGPQHEVEITKPFYMGVHEVTQEEYEQVMGTNRSRIQFKGKKNPVESVSYDDAVEFCRKLTALEQKARQKGDPGASATGVTYRLPTEAEWEYACRASSSKAYCFGDDAGQLEEYAWYNNNSGRKTHPVGTRKANAFGLHDMHGNVWEWCADWYDEDYYKQLPAADPRGPSSASSRVIRGGSWDSVGGFCRSATRYWHAPVYRYPLLGFRVAAVQSLGSKLSSETKVDPKPEPPLEAKVDPKLPIDPNPQSAIPNPQSFANSLGMKLVLIPAGKFTMGSPAFEKDHRDDEGPQHEVEISKPFYLGAYEVTQGEYEQLMGTNPSSFKGKKNPVGNVSWNDAVEFCRKLTALEQKTRQNGEPGASATGVTYRLPTEAEWEYACRAGTKTVFHCGDSLSSAQANFNGAYPYGGAPKGKYLNKTVPVGSYPPNAFGLHDMHGNVYEWCADYYDDKYYATSPIRDPQGPTSGSLHVSRGGSWYFDARGCRAAQRVGDVPGNPGLLIGFRVVCVPAPRTPDTKPVFVIPPAPVPK